jgi:hypothetical protein
MKRGVVLKRVISEGLMMSRENDGIPFLHRLLPPCLQGTERHRSSLKRNIQCSSALCSDPEGKIKNEKRRAADETDITGGIMSPGIETDTPSTGVERV